MANRISILDSTGKPFSKNGHAQPVAEPIRRKSMQARYDAASDSSEYANIWGNADACDADSANSREVRQKLVARSRYEVQNNGYADGIASTYATDLVGTGPALRMQTGSLGFNQLVEQQWYLWTKAIQWRRKLWCLAHAKHVDGEGLGVVRTNRKVNHPVKLDVVLYETEQCQTPRLPYATRGYGDGLKFDEFGNVEHYDILREHPGSTQYARLALEPEQVPARFVLHWFKLRRPGQHRAVPENSSTLNSGAAARRWREATLAAAETAADFTLFLKTLFQPDEITAIPSMSTMDIQKRMMTALPLGYEPFQMKAEHPTATYEAFHKSLVSEQARPKSMPYNKAACDSSSYNYASGRLDHQTYYAHLDVEREDGNDLALDPLFDLWFDEAVRVFGWLGGNPNAISPAGRLHLWDWPKHRAVDIQAEAKANDSQLRNGSVSLSKVYSERGEDYEDEVERMAADYGVSVVEMRQILLKTIFAKATAEPPAAPEVPDDEQDNQSDEDQP